MKSSPKPLAIVSVLFVVGAGGCVLIGYDLTGYVPAADAGVEDAGKGGGGGGAGSGGGPSSASESAASSTSSNINCPNNCEDNNACTEDICVPSGCTNLPKPMEDDSNVCTMDGCDPVKGPTHDQLPDCCPHSLCKAGVPLNSICNPPHILDNCISNVCLARPSCCSKVWDTSCIALVPQYCTSKENPNLTITCGSCEHSYCEIGKPLTPTCDPCVYAISEIMSGCTMVEWTAACVELTHSRCGIPRDANCQ